MDQHVHVDHINEVNNVEKHLGELRVGANVCPIQSLDYEIIENELFTQDWRSVKIARYVFLKWAFALVIGVLTGLVGVFNNIAVENISGFKLLLMTNLMFKGKYLNAFLAFGGCNVGLSVVAGTLCAIMAPAATGSGIPEVKAYLNGVDAPSILAPTTLFVKIFGSALGASAGLVVGKQGPMVHTGACIASILGQSGSNKFGLTWTPLKYFNNDRDRRDLITCGAAAGVAAAFRAPIGGVLFALEEAASWSQNALLWRAFFTTATVAIVLRSFSTYCWTGKCGLFGHGGLIMYDVSTVEETYTSFDLLTVTFLGVIGGLLGSLFNYLVDIVLRIYKTINKKGSPYRILLVIFISVLTTCCAFGLPWFAKCTPCPTGKCPGVGESGNNYKRFQCEPGHYNDLASLFLNTNDNAIRNLLRTKTRGEFRISSLFIFFITIYVLSIITYGISVPAGLFVPIILSGAVFGRVVGRLFGSVSKLDTGLFSLLGAASFLGGTMRTPVSICVILLELSNDLLLLPLVMITLLISKTVGDIFNRGICDQIVELKGLPFMEANPEPYMKLLMVGQVVSHPLIAFSGVEKVANIVHALRFSKHNGYPVIDEPPFSDTSELCGLVLRSHLLVLLKAKCFSKVRVRSTKKILERFSPFDFAKPSCSAKELGDIRIEDEEMEMYVDLKPVTNTSPYTVVETMSLAKAHILMRQLGLRHICVVPKSQRISPTLFSFNIKPPIVGVLTRHDFTPEHILGLYPNIKDMKKNAPRHDPPTTTAQNVEASYGAMHKLYCASMQAQG